jgi:hypothetical protein
MKTRKAPKTKAPLVSINYERLRSISGAVQLRDVLLTHTHLQSFIVATKLSMNPEAMMYMFELTDATWDLDREKNILEIQLKYKLHAAVGTQKGQQEPAPLFHLQCEWSVIFGVSEEIDPETSEDVMADFAVANGQLNAFPYVRQYVQDVTGRAGWPPLVLPTFRIPSKRKESIGGRLQQQSLT